MHFNFFVGVLITLVCGVSFGLGQVPYDPTPFDIIGTINVL
jgi:hypothetical protein